HLCPDVAAAPPPQVSPGGAGRRGARRLGDGLLPAGAAPAARRTGGPRPRLLPVLRGRGPVPPGPPGRLGRAPRAGAGGRPPHPAPRAPGAAALAPADAPRPADLRRQALAALAGLAARLGRAGRGVVEAPPGEGSRR